MIDLFSGERALPALAPRVAGSLIWRSIYSLSEDIAGCLARPSRELHLFMRKYPSLTTCLQPGRPRHTQTYLTGVSPFCPSPEKPGSEWEVAVGNPQNHLLMPHLRGCQKFPPCSSYLCLLHICCPCSVTGSNSCLRAASQLFPVCFSTLDLYICGLALSLGSVMLGAGGYWKCTPPSRGSSFIRATSWMAHWRASAEHSIPNTPVSALRPRTGLMQSIR